MESEEYQIEGGNMECLDLLRCGLPRLFPEFNSA